MFRKRHAVVQHGAIRFNNWLTAGESANPPAEGAKTRLHF